MAKMVIEIRGLKELNAKFKRIDGNLKPAMTKAMNKAVTYVHSTVPPYPPEPPGSTYTRTGTLGREIGTEVKSIGAEVVGLIGTPTVYAPYVIDEDRQAYMHKGRWWTLQEVVRKARGEIVEIFQEAVRKLLRS